MTWLWLLLMGVVGFGAMPSHAQIDDDPIDPESISIIRDLNSSIYEPEESVNEADEPEESVNEADETEEAIDGHDDGASEFSDPQKLDDDKIENIADDDHNRPALDSDPGTMRATSTLAPDRGKIFGAYKTHIGASKPEFAKADEYELIYGNSRFIPTLAVEHFFFDWYATLGVIFRFGYYKDQGNAVVKEGDSYIKDNDGAVELTLVPLQAGLTAQMTPFPAKWITVGGWFAGEATYFQEVRLKSKNGDTAAGPSLASETDDASSSKSLTNSGWRYGSNVGASLSFLLNGLDRRTVSTLRPIGIGSVYFTPYIEATTGMFNKSDFDLSRMSMGAAFTFESL